MHETTHRNIHKIVHTKTHTNTSTHTTLQYGKSSKLRMSFFCSNIVSQLFLLNECIFETKNLKPYTHEKWTHVHTNRRGIHFILWLSFCIMRICLFYSFFIVFLSFCLSVFMCLCNSGIKVFVSLYLCVFVCICVCV